MYNLYAFVRLLAQAASPQRGSIDGWLEILGTIAIFWLALTTAQMGLLAVRRKRQRWVAYIFLIVLTVIAIPSAIALGVVAFCGVFVMCALLWLQAQWWLKREDFFDNPRLSKKLARLAKQDAIWSEQHMLDSAQEIFEQYKKDMTEANFESMQLYATPDLVERSRQLTRIFSELHWRNILQVTTVHRKRVYNFTKKSDDDTEDAYSVWFEVTTTEKTEDALVDRTLTENENYFVHIWYFVRSGHNWVLKSIRQPKADDEPARRREQDVVNFAASNGMHYSANLGWLVLPDGGTLLRSGSYSDGNELGAGEVLDHLVGERHSSLMQLFILCLNKEYERINQKITMPKYYIVGVLTLPKSYGGILVRPVKTVTATTELSKKLFEGVPKDYVKHEFEWPDFNSRYDVYATDADKLSVFELVNPDFMSFMYNAGSKITLEVVGNVVYIYQPTRDVVGHGLQGYERILGIMNRAYKELKL